MSKAFPDFKSFYPYYLQEHSDINCRRMHFVGTSLVIGIVLLAVWQANPLWLLLVPVAGYGFAWIGHFFFEHNKPATFNYPLYSLAGDFVMYKDILLGKVKI